MPRDRLRSHVAVAAALVALAVSLAGSRQGFAQPMAPPHADPAFEYLVEGRVVLGDGRAAVGVRVERAQTLHHIAESTTTNARGEFRFASRGLGFGPGLQWTLIVYRAGCAPVTHTVELRAGPTNGRPGDVATGVVVRLPACAASAPPTPTPSPTPTPPPTTSRGG